MLSARPRAYSAERKELAATADASAWVATAAKPFPGKGSQCGGFPAQGCHLLLNYLASFLDLCWRFDSRGFCSLPPVGLSALGAQAAGRVAGVAPPPAGVVRKGGAAAGWNWTGSELSAQLVSGACLCGGGRICALSSHPVLVVSVVAARLRACEAAPCTGVNAGCAARWLYRVPRLVSVVRITALRGHNFSTGVGWLGRHNSPVPSGRSLERGRLLVLRGVASRGGGGGAAGAPLARLLSWGSASFRCPARGSGGQAQWPRVTSRPCAQPLPAEQSVLCSSVSGVVVEGGQGRGHVLLYSVFSA